MDALSTTIVIILVILFIMCLIVMISAWIVKITIRNHHLFNNLDEDGHPWDKVFEDEKKSKRLHKGEP